MPGSVVVSSREGMKEWSKGHMRGEKVRVRFHTLPGRVEIERPGKADTVARFLVEVPAEVEHQQSLRQMEFMMRALKCGDRFEPTDISSKTFQYQPPEPLDYSKGVESGQQARHNRMVRDYGFEPRPYRSMTYEIRGDQADELVKTIMAEREDIRYLEQTWEDGDTSGVYFKEDDPMSMAIFGSGTLRAGLGDFTKETYSFLAAAEAEADLDFELDEDWLTVGDHGVPRA